MCCVVVVAVFGFFGLRVVAVDSKEKERKKKVLLSFVRDVRRERLINIS